MRRLVLTGLVLAVLGIASRAGAQTAALSLSIPPTGRANGMGEAYVAIADDATATWWNPGGLAFLKEKEASLSYAKLVPGLANDVFIMFPAAVRPDVLGGTLGVSMVYLSYGTSEATSNTGENLGTFTSYEIAPTLSYGTKITNLVGFGVSAKYVRVQLAPQLPGLPGAGTGSTIAFDAGMLVKLPGDMVRLGVAVQNVGPDIHFISDEHHDPIYRNAKAGFAINAFDNKVFHATLIGDVNQLLVRGDVDNGDGTFSHPYQKPIYNGGGEVGYTGEVAVAVRGGYVHDADGSIKDPTYGLGIGYKQLDFDYASIPQAKDAASGQKLDRVSKFSIGVRF